MEALLAIAIGSAALLICLWAFGPFPERVAETLFLILTWPARVWLHVVGKATGFEIYGEEFRDRD